MPDFRPEYSPPRPLPAILIAGIRRSSCLWPKIAALIAAIAVLALAGASLAAPGIEGLWLTANGEGHIEIRVQDGTIAGFIARSPRKHDVTRLDDKNPEPGLRERPLLGLKIIHDLRAAGDQRWKGRIYDPNSGKTYQCTVTLADDNTLKLRGYVAVSLLGRTEVWTRVREL